MTASSNWTGGRIPVWTLGDKLRKARLDAGLDQRELAAELGIARNSVMTYESGKTAPRRPVLLAWAMRTGVSLDWLTGETPGRPDGDAGWAPTGSNRQPADYKVDGSPATVTHSEYVARVIPLTPRRRGADVGPRQATA